jgi:hypothetical protein
MQILLLCNALAHVGVSSYARPDGDSNSCSNLAVQLNRQLGRTSCLAEHIAVGSIHWGEQVRTVAIGPKKERAGEQVRLTSAL